MGKNTLLCHDDSPECIPGQGAITKNPDADGQICETYADTLDIRNSCHLQGIKLKDAFRLFDLPPNEILEHWSRDTQTTHILDMYKSSQKDPDFWTGELQNGRPNVMRAAELFLFSNNLITTTPYIDLTDTRSKNPIVAKLLPSLPENPQRNKIDQYTADWMSHTLRKAPSEEIEKLNLETIYQQVHTLIGQLMGPNGINIVQQAIPAPKESPETPQPPNVTWETISFLPPQSTTQSTTEKKSPKRKSAKKKKK